MTQQKTAGFVQYKDNRRFTMGFKIPYDTWEPAYFDVCESYLQLRRSTAVLFNTSV
jgi:hypothetical protein